MKGGGTGEVDTQGGLTHGRAACHDDHLPGLKALGHIVDALESGGHTTLCISVLQLVQLLQGVVDHRPDGLVILTDLARTHLVDFGLCHVDDVFSLGPFSRVPQLGNLGTGGDDVAKDGPLVDDFGVVGSVRRRGDRGHQGVEVIGAAYLVQVTGFEEFVGHQNSIHGLRGREEGDDGLINGLMLGLVEVGHVNHLTDLSDGVLAHQHPAKDGHLGIVVMRGDPIEDHVTRAAILSRRTLLGVSVVGGVFRNHRFDSTDGTYRLRGFGRF